MKTQIVLSSDYHYENLVAEVYIDDKFIALVSYDEKEDFFVETPTNNDENPSNKTPYEMYINLLSAAKSKLLGE